MRKFVYVATDGEYYKIGVTSDLRRRAAQLSNAKEIRYITALPVRDSLAYEIESRLHKMFDDRRLHGEWFDLSSDEVEWVSSFQIQTEIVKVIDNGEKVVEFKVKEIFSSPRDYTALTTPWATKGWNDFYRRKKIDDNPFFDYMPEYASWRNGWLLAADACLDLYLFMEKKRDKITSEWEELAKKVDKLILELWKL